MMHEIFSNLLAKLDIGEEDNPSNEDNNVFTLLIKCATREND